jgi:pimeloyl-ACP methyl ester carboxylesterase
MSAETSEAVLLTTTAADGTSVRALDEGRGPNILILHPGMETGTRYARVARLLSRRFRVIGIHRRQYRLDLKRDPAIGSPCTVAQEVEHVLALVAHVGAPVVLYGHSSGGPVALEALLASPASFAGCLVYEPASVMGTPDGERLVGDVIPRDDEVGEGVRRARAALVAQKPGKALAIFTGIAAGWPAWLCSLAGMLTAAIPSYRRLIPCQIDDLEAMERLGNRLAAYAGIERPVALIGGERSPALLKQTVAAVASTIPGAELLVLRGQGHDGHARDAKQLAGLIEAFAGKVLS